MSDKPKFPRAEALAVAKIFCDFLSPFCQKLIVAGSLRRRKESVGDVELVYVSKLATERDGLFDSVRVALVDKLLGDLERNGTIARRHNINGAEMWGAKNKLAFHGASGVPVDFFAATNANWFNYLVCRTGGARSNTEIASAAQRKGWKWNPYGEGFTDERGALVRVTSERDAFELVGLPYREPWERL